MCRVPLLVVGGFRGETTLVERSARLLGTEGLRVGIVTNDQAADPTYRYAAAVQP
jgi:hypothetical protein